jgi:hypothetical protein
MGSWGSKPSDVPTPSEIEQLRDQQLEKDKITEAQRDVELRLRFYTRIRAQASSFTPCANVFVNEWLRPRLISELRQQGFTVDEHSPAQWSSLRVCLKSNKPSTPAVSVLAVPEEHPEGTAAQTPAQ